MEIKNKIDKYLKEREKKKMAGLREKKSRLEAEAAKKIEEMELRDGIARAEEVIKDYDKKHSLKGRLSKGIARLQENAKEYEGFKEEYDNSVMDEDRIYEFIGGKRDGNRRIEV